MASSITYDMGKAASAPLRVIRFSIDLSTITSYSTGGHLDPDGVLTAAVTGLTYISIPDFHYDGTESRMFKVNPANHQILAYDAATLEETTATDTLAGHDAVPITIIAY